MVAYKVGSGDEEKDQTGLSHYLEHLLFKGTDKLMPGDIDRATQRNGGRNNAYTNEDMTVYHFDFAADRWQIALEIEADRMRNIRIDAKHEFEQEKGAVIAELDGNEDRPWDLEYKAILPLLFPKDSPYSHPVIGEESTSAARPPRSSSGTTTSGTTRTTRRSSSSAGSTRTRRWRRSRSCSGRSRRATCRRARPPTALQGPRAARSARSSSRSSTCRG